jgi:NAD(P) transhydrogenase subunit beta
MSQQIIDLSYLISAICFILALKFLSSPREAKMGTMVGVIGMCLALIATIFLPNFTNKTALLIVIFSGAIVGTIIAKKISMTALPQLVAGFHSFVGLAAVLVAYSTILTPETFSVSIKGFIPVNALIEVSLGAAIGAITFTGSIIAFAKLQGLMSASPWKFKGQQYVCLILTIAIIMLIIFFTKTENIGIFNLLVFLSLLIGILLIVPIGGADMPVVISMLNSYSGFAAAGIGFTVGSSLLIITGAIVGTSGIILSYIMCKAMNRSLINVVFGAFFQNSVTSNNNKFSDKSVKATNAEDSAYLLSNASSVIIVPGYGMAVAQSQHVIKELTNMLEKEDILVRFAVHPVAGRMPGHMNVLLAEAGIDYEKVLELDEINRDFVNTDVVIVVGANDVTNPAAKNDPTSPIYGMPILDVDKAKTILFIKRSMAQGYAGIENELFYAPNTLMLFGDAKKVIEEIVKHLTNN